MCWTCSEQWIAMTRRQAPSETEACAMAQRHLAVFNIVFARAPVVITCKLCVHEVAPGGKSFNVWPCVLDGHSDSPTLVLPSPGQDQIRLWPLPVQQPW